MCCVFVLHKMFTIKFCLIVDIWVLIVVELYANHHCKTLILSAYIRLAAAFRGLLGHALTH